MSAPTEHEATNADEGDQKHAASPSMAGDAAIDIPGIGRVGMADYLPHPVNDTIATDIFRKWRNAGSPHNPLCYACREKHQGIAIGCMTCCRVYHPMCLPSEPQRLQAWHCPICVDMRWDTAPPSTNANREGGNSA